MEYKAPNGESWRKVQERATQFIREKAGPTATLAKGGLLLFTHGGLICSLTHDLQLPDIVSNGSIVAIKLDKDGTPLRVEQVWEFPLEAVM